MNEAYAKLTYPAQLRLERRIAEAALTHYGIVDARLKLLAHVFNKTFRVTASDGQQFSLRLQREYNLANPRYIRSEHVWLTALRHDTDLLVPQPLANADGDLLTTINDPIAGERFCTLFRWQPGRVVGRAITPGIMRGVGASMAQLHQHAARFQPPPGFERPRWDWPHIAGPQSAFGYGWLDPYLDAADRAVYVAVSQRLAAVMVELGEDEANWGLIHFDLHPWNVLSVGSKRLALLDFEIGGWGHWLLDFAPPLEAFLTRLDLPALRAALLEGYATVRPLPDRCAELLDTFMAARLLCIANWLFDSEEPQVRQERAGTIKRVAGRLEALLKLRG